MLSIESKNKNDIGNIIIKFFSLGDNFHAYDDQYPVVTIENISYIDEYNLSIKIKILQMNEKYNGNVNIYILNKYNFNEYTVVPFTNFYNSSFIVVNTPFILKRDDNTKQYKIPKIIHQSYKKQMLYPNCYIATNTWKNMNINYEYKFWDDISVENIIKNNFDKKVWEAYNMLYAGAYKSDIFRLCILYIEGGVWTDISSICEYPLDLLIDSSFDLLICKDTPSQVHNANIYQAFIITPPENEIIKYILNITVDRVLNNETYDLTYPFIKGESIAVTGPTIFAIALNQYLENSIFKIFEEGAITKNNLIIKIINHIPGKIIKENTKIITTKYDNFIKDRYNAHYSTLTSKGYIFKKKIENTILSNNNKYLYQIWIQSNFVSHNMENAINTWKTNNLDWNYVLMTNDSIIEMLQNDKEFPDLYDSYQRLKPYAFKSDLIRIYLLYKTGGIYADTDSICYENIDNMNYNQDLVLCIDIGNNALSNGFIYSSKKENPFLKFVLEKMVSNINSKNMNHSDLSITGPVLFGQCFTEYFGIHKPFTPNTFNLNNQTVKLIQYSFNLPMPSGTWINSCKNSSVTNTNILKTHARKINGQYQYNEIRFKITDHLHNDNGKIINNTYIVYPDCDGGGIMYDSEKNVVILASKYNEYNEERILLDGNNFAQMYKENNIFN